MPIDSPSFSNYELAALEQVRAWKAEKPGLISRTVTLVGWPAAKVTELAFKLPGMARAVEMTVGGLMELTHNAAAWSVRREAVFEDYREAGHKVYALADIAALELEQADRVIGRIDLKYQSLTATEGVAAGALGLPGVPADVAASAALNLRAAGEYATYYGFDLEADAERLFALSILNLAAMNSAREKREALGRIEDLAREISLQKAGDKFEKQSFARLVKALARGLTRALAQDKAAQTIPIFGAAVGAGTNFLYTDDVCAAAYHLYRERFLARRHGPDAVFPLTRPGPIKSFFDWSS